jgi:hypothetical protein
MEKKDHLHAPAHQSGYAIWRPERDLVKIRFARGRPTGSPGGGQLVCRGRTGQLVHPGEVNWFAGDGRANWFTRGRSTGLPGTADGPTGLPDDRPANWFTRGRPTGLRRDPGPSRGRSKNPHLDIHRWRQSKVHVFIHGREGIVPVFHDLFTFGRGLILLLSCCRRPQLPATIPIRFHDRRIEGHPAPQNSATSRDEGVTPT